MISFYSTSTSPVPGKIVTEENVNKYMVTKKWLLCYFYLLLLFGLSLWRRSLTMKMESRKRCVKWKGERTGI